MNRAWVVGLLCLACTLQGCALFSKNDVPLRRYYSPDMPLSGSEARGLARGFELRLGRVTAGVSIAERIVFRESAHELGFYEDRLWTEKPEVYLRRGLSYVLFEEQGLRSVLRGSGPTLDVELITFEEVRAPRHVARVKIAFTLSDERLASLQQTVEIERPLAKSSSDDAASELARALGEALRDAIDQISGQVMAKIITVPARPVATSP